MSAAEPAEGDAGGQEADEVCMTTSAAESQVHQSSAAAGAAKPNAIGVAQKMTAKAARQPVSRHPGRAGSGSTDCGRRHARATGVPAPGLQKRRSGRPTPAWPLRPDCRPPARPENAGRERIDAEMLHGRRIRSAPPQRKRHAGDDGRPGQRQGDPPHRLRRRATQRAADFERTDRLFEKRRPLSR